MDESIEERRWRKFHFFLCWSIHSTSKLKKKQVTKFRVFKSSPHCTLQKNTCFSFRISSLIFIHKPTALFSLNLISTVCWSPCFVNSHSSKQLLGSPNSVWHGWLVGLHWRPALPGDHFWPKGVAAYWGWDSDYSDRDWKGNFTAGKNASVSVIIINPPDDVGKMTPCEHMMDKTMPISWWIGVPASINFCTCAQSTWWMGNSPVFPLSRFNRNTNSKSSTCGWWTKIAHSVGMF